MGRPTLYLDLLLRDVDREGDLDLLLASVAPTPPVKWLMSLNDMIHIRCDICFSQSRFVPLNQQINTCFNFTIGYTRLSCRSRRPGCPPWPSPSPCWRRTSSCGTAPPCAQLADLFFSYFSRARGGANHDSNSRIRLKIALLFDSFVNKIRINDS